MVNAVIAVGLIAVDGWFTVVIAIVMLLIIEKLVLAIVDIGVVVGTVVGRILVAASLKKSKKIVIKWKEIRKFAKFTGCEHSNCG